MSRHQKKPAAKMPKVKRAKNVKPQTTRDGRLKVHIVPKEGKVREELLPFLKKKHGDFVIVARPHDATLIIHDDPVTLQQVRKHPNEEHVLICTEDEVPTLKQTTGIEAISIPVMIEAVKNGSSSFLTDRSPQKQKNAA